MDFTYSVLDELCAQLVHSIGSIAYLKHISYLQMQINTRRGPRASLGKAVLGRTEASFPPVLMPKRYIGTSRSLYKIRPNYLGTNTCMQYS